MSKHAVEIRLRPAAPAQRRRAPAGGRMSSRTAAAASAKACEVACKEGNQVQASVDIDRFATSFDFTGPGRRDPLRRVGAPHRSLSAAIGA